MSSFSSFFLCFLIHSCVLIVYSLQIVCGKQPHCHGATNRERKLTKTLFIVTVVSSLLTLPLIIFRSCYEVPLYTYSKNYFASKNLSVILLFRFFFYFIQNHWSIQILEIQGSNELCFHFCIAYPRRNLLRLSRLTKSKAH